MGPDDIRGSNISTIQVSHTVFSATHTHTCEQVVAFIYYRQMCRERKREKGAGRCGAFLVSFYSASLAGDDPQLRTQGVKGPQFLKGGARPAMQNMLNGDQKTWSRCDFEGMEKASG